jgi:signal transduction histidine kinase
MNIVTRLTLFFILASLLVFIIGGVITFQVMKKEIDSEQNRFLKERLGHTLKMIERKNIGKEIIRDKVHIKPLITKVKDSKIEYSDTLVMHSTLQRPEWHTKLDVIRNVNETSYAITLYDVIIETDDISEAVIESLVKTYIVLLLAFSALGLLLSYYFMYPFRRTLEIINSYSISETELLKFPKTSISEFKKLNDFLSQMTKKIQSDYQSLKDFSENASHELQTPITVIQGKLDVMMQEEGLNERQLKLIESTQMAAKRLSNLSNSLSLLTKIDNLEFSKVEKIDLGVVVNQIIEEFEELITLKSIDYNIRINAQASVEADPNLIEILVINLINNAIKHTVQDGIIDIQINNNGFIISNSGNPITSDPNKFFERFAKSNSSDSSLGLGLAIVKKICDVFGYKIDYTNDSDRHKISVIFKI